MDTAALETINRLTHFFGKAVSVVTNLLDPDVIVVEGGGVRQCTCHLYSWCWITEKTHI